ncbi:hypothetical protein RJ639_014591 [Escallonia herrerae]|uniref:glutathione transferase n=1 Tax=Escallonia herrerae TaxID=1293975 RepID=A0AA89AMD9_9ASTE|nr:hypothetical protein RJ639_014591 [Escallonia herrerae]
MRALVSLLEHDLRFEFLPIDLNDLLKEPFLSLSVMLLYLSIPFKLRRVSLSFLKANKILKAEHLDSESRAIMRSISHVYPKPGKEQIYMEPKLQGIVATWIDVEDHLFNPPASQLISELVFEVLDEAVVAEAEAKLAEVLDVYEERLSGFKYLGGDKFTSADLTHLPSLYYLMSTSILLERPHVSVWCREIMSRPAWTKVVQMVEKAACA